MSHLTKISSKVSAMTGFWSLDTGYLCLVLYAFFLMSCSGKHETDKNIFHYNEQTGIASLDPAFAKNQSIMWVVHQLYNTLVEVDQDLNIVPSLAKSWEISGDRRTYVFHLRSDVLFHDDVVFKNGKVRRLIAKDIEFSFKRIIDRRTASPGAWIFNRKVDSVNGLKAINDSTFQLVLVRPYMPILGIL